MLLGEPLDGAGKHFFGWGNATRPGPWPGRQSPLRSVFPSVACDAPLAWFAAAACVPLPSERSTMWSR